MIFIITLVKNFVLHIEFHITNQIIFGRASIEPNFHDLYLKFLERVNSRALNKEIVKATYENCKVLSHSLIIFFHEYCTKDDFCLHASFRFF